MRDWRRYVDIPSSDPVVLYQDLLFALQAERQVNNGSPSLHASGLHQLALQQGQTVCHIGAGSGYYTAIIAASSAMMAVSSLSNSTRRWQSKPLNLSEYRNVEVIHGNGLEWPQQQQMRST
jgi:protein-L-isoaspartate(D-aspartate) O-methyltransferase